MVASLPLGIGAGRGPHALNNDLPDARDRLFRFVSQRGNAQQRQAEQYPGDAKYFMRQSPLVLQ